jgi:hypothetical protein
MTGAWMRRSAAARPVSMVIALCVATFGLYLFYWFHRAWQRLARLGYVRGSAESRTVIFLLPIVNIVLIYELFGGLHAAARAKGLRTFSTPAMLTVLAVSLGGIALAVGLWPVILAVTAKASPGLHGLIASVPLRTPSVLAALASAASTAVIPALAQGTLNELEDDDTGSRTRAAFSLVEAAILAVGGMLWLFNLR